MGKSRTRIHTQTQILDAAHLKTRTLKNESLPEYAVLRGKDLEDSLLWYYLGNDGSSKEQQETVQNIVEE